MPERASDGAYIVRPVPPTPRARPATPNAAMTPAPRRKEAVPTPPRHGSLGRSFAVVDPERLREVDPEQPRPGGSTPVKAPAPGRSRPPGAARP